MGVDLFVSLAEGSWWRTSFATQHWSSPLQISVTLKSSTGCSEGAATDGTCMFGLKLYGSKHGPPTADDYEQHDEGSHHAGEEYRLLVPACSLQNAGRYYIGLRGWDGTNQIKLRADEGAPHCPPIAPYPAADRSPCVARRASRRAVRFPLSQPVCPALGDDQTPASGPGDCCLGRGGKAMTRGK